MGWLRVGRAGGPEPKVVRAPRWPDAALAAAVAEADEGRVRAAGTVLAECRTDPELRAHRVDVLAERLIGFGERVLDIGVQTRDPDMFLLAGAIFTKEAWAIRGTGLSATVGEKRFRVFHSHLTQAVVPLRRAADLLADDPVPWSEMFPVSRGLEFDRAHKDQLWSEVDRRAPLLVSANDSRVQTLAPKWGKGDESEMLAFAHERVALAPDGHPVVAVLVSAVFETAAHHDRRVGNVGRFVAKWRDDLVAASTKLLTGTLALPRTTWAHNMFAAIFVAMGDYEHAEPHLRAMAGHVSVAAWDWVGGEHRYVTAAGRLRNP